MSLPLGNLPDTRYPDPRIERLDPRFLYKQGNAAIERIATGFRWAEGPVYFRDGGYLLFSDIPNNRIMRWLEEDGHLSVFRAPSNYANGNTRDREGRLITCEHDARRVTRTELDGHVTVLLDRFEGKPLNAPNDVVVASDGAVWFTDPGYGIDGPYEGHKANSRTAAQRVSAGPYERCGQRRGGRLRAAQWALLLAGRTASLYRRFRHLARRPGAHSRLRRGRRTTAQRPCVRQ